MSTIVSYRYKVLCCTAQVPSTDVRVRVRVEVEVGENEWESE